MTMIHDCIPCQHGDHSGHIDTPGTVPKGMLGGWQCPCTGDCAERYPKQDPAPVKWDTTDYAAWGEFVKELEALRDGS